MILGFYAGILSLLLIISVSSYQTEHCTKVQTKGEVKLNPEHNITAPLNEDEEREREISEYAKSHPEVCGVNGFPRMVVGYMDHHEGFFVGFFTLALVFATALLWRSTEKLWAAGERQIEIARRSADAAVEALSGNRAWILHSGVQTVPFSGATNVSDGTTGHEGVMFAIIWKNCGTTPAIGPEISIEGISCPVKTRVPDFISRFDNVEKRSTPLAPDGSFQSGWFYVYSLNFENFKNRIEKIVIYSKVRYFDIYKPGIERISEVCVEIYYDGTKTDNVTRATMLNCAIMPAGPQNTAS